MPRSCGGHKLNTMEDPLEAGVAASQQVSWGREERWPSARAAGPAGLRGWVRALSLCKGKPTEGLSQE